MKSKATTRVDYSTVAELRDALEGAPDDAEVRVRTRMLGAGADGQKIKRITVSFGER